LEHAEGPDIYRSLKKAIYLFAGLVVLLWFLHQIGVVIVASILSLILAVALNAPVTWLERRYMSRGVATILTFFVLLIVSVFIGWLIIPRLAREIPSLIDQVPALVESFTRQVLAVVGDHPEIQRQLTRVADWGFSAFEELWRYADVVAGGLVLGLFIVALVLYMVANLPEILAWYVRSMAPHLREPATRAFAKSSRMVIGWVIASVILGGIKGVAAGFFLTFMGIPGALVWAFIAFLGAFIPRVGFYLMTFPPVLVAFSVDPMTALWTLVFYVAASEFLGNFVAPRIYAQSMQMNAVFILFMTLAMGYAFGVIGVLIATPVAGFLKSYYDEFFLKRRPKEPDIELHLNAMMTRRPELIEDDAA
jgi:putative permease